MSVDTSTTTVEETWPADGARARPPRVFEPVFSAPGLVVGAFFSRANLESWVAVTDPAGWTAVRTDALAAILDAQPASGD